MEPATLDLPTPVASPTPHTRARVRPRSVWRALLPWMVLALGLRLLVLDLVPSTPSWDGPIYVRGAELLAAGEGYTLRIFGPEQEPKATAFYPVGFPALLALVRMLGGGLAADRVLQTVISAALVPLAYLLARRGFGERAARTAAAIATLWPSAVLLSATWLAEPAFALALALALMPVLYARRAHRMRALMLASLGLGVAAYLRPTALVVAALLGALVSASNARTAARAIGRALLGASLATLLACVPLTPWALRNAEQLGAPVLVSTNGGVNLLLGTLEEGSFERLPEPEPCRAAHLDELARDRCFRDRALVTIAADPLGYAGRSLLKLAHTFGHESASAQALIATLPVGPRRDSAAVWLLGLCRVGWLLLVPCIAIGTVSALRRAPRARSLSRQLLLLPVLAVAALHAVFVAGDRYHAAVIPMLAALAGSGAARLLQTDGRGVARPRATTR